jgi:CPA1 family monovalent cation:H+ antiporter
MHAGPSELIFAGLLLIAALAILAKSLRIAYPIVFVVAGGLIAFIPGLPQIELKPDIVFLLFLPPLLYSGGFSTEWRDFRRQIGPIVFMAIGLVAATTVLVALVAHALIGMPLAAAFVLGAIVSPPDAVAIEALSDELALPRPLAAILSGEGLINDATALVIYRFAITATIAGAFSWWQAGLLFVYVSIVGILVGALGFSALAALLQFLRKRGLTDALILTLFSLITPYVTYLLADALGASGVLAAVTAGILTSRKLTMLFDAEARIAAGGVWPLLTFSFNGVLFILLGGQLRSIVASLHAYSPGELALYGIAVSATVILVRFAWVYPMTWFRAVVILRTPRDERPTWRGMFIASWSGMRGIVTLAAALGIPEMAGSAPFPARNLILFLAYCVIVVTLVVQGLTLPYFVRRFDVLDDESRPHDLTVARTAAAEAVLAMLTSIEPTLSSPLQWEVAGRLRERYERRIAQLRTDPAAIARQDAEQPLAIERELSRAAYDAERETLFRLRRSGEIGDAVFRELEWDIDLAESRLD